jgi:L-2-hydroxyglutarate oxidase LhgO
VQLPNWNLAKPRFQALPPLYDLNLRRVSRLAIAGVFYCQGTFQNLANALVEALTKKSGEILLQSRVRRIIVKENRVTGVILENG